MGKKTSKTKTFAPVYRYERVGTGDILGLNACLIGDKWVRTSEVSKDFWEQ